MSLLQIYEPGQTPQPHAQPVKPAIGIDLGTTHSVVAFSHLQEVAVFSDDAGHTIIPSVVAATADSGLMVGHEAQLLSDSVASVKRLMGRSIRDVHEVKDTLPFTLVDQGDDIIRIQLGKHLLTPVEISGHILRHMRSIAESAMECPLGEAVITVPAYFDDAARTATRDAARLAGLEVLRLINEPTAAALAYGLDSEAEGCFAIYDLGGGTFDISILKLDQGVFQVLSTGGHTQLGGDDIDRAIVTHLSSRHIIDAQPHAQRRWLRIARQLKEALSNADEAEIESVRLTRAELETLAVGFVANSIGICERALDDTGLSKEQIDGVVLVGGSTRMPLVRAEVERFFGKRPLDSIDPDEVVAVGAAIQAEALTRGASHLLLDVTPLSLGLETIGGIVEKIIHRNTPIPISTSQEFTTYQDGQSAMKIHVLQGERELVDQCRSLANFVLTDIPPLPANLARIRVTFTVDADGLLTVTAREMTTGAEQHVEVKPSYGLPIERIEAMLRESMEHAESDILQRLLIESRVEAQRVIHDIVSAVHADRELLSEGEHAGIMQAISQLQAVLQEDNRDAIDAQTQQLNELTNPFAARRMDKAIASALEGTHIDEYPDKMKETHA